MKLENLECMKFSEVIAKIAFRMSQRHVFTNCDMAIDTPQNVTPDESMESIYHGSCAWMGIKEIDSPFDSDSVLYMVDMYGGGAAQMIEVYHGMELTDIIDATHKAFVDCIECNGYSMQDDWLVLIEWVD